MPRLLIAAFAFLAVACGAKNPNFCEGDSCTEVDASIDAAPVSCTGSGGDPTCPATTPVCESGECTGMCTADTDCSGRAASEAVCLTSTGACVQCDETNVQATPGQAEDECPAPQMAVCDGDTHTCRACEEHSECFSGVCDAGTCVAQANVIYLSPAADGGTDGGSNDCLSASTGCLTLHYAISKVTATRKYIVFKPSATPYPVRNNTDRADFNGVVAHVIGYGAEVRRMGADGMVIEVRGGSNVTIEGLKVANATNSGSGFGILVASSELTLFEARIQDNASTGISVSGSGASLRSTRSIISGNDGGGILVSAAPFVIINNFIVNNGDANSGVAGLNLLSSGATSVLEFNTIVDNRAQSGVEDVDCTNNMLTARNNIVHGAAGETRIGGTCVFRNTLYGPDGTISGTGNVLVADKTTYRFMSPSDYHIDPAASPASVVIGAADSAGLTGEMLFDIDGQARAAGASTVEVGADEIP
jgi:hypothetical protein